MDNIKIAHCIYSIDKYDGGPSRSIPLLCKGLSELDVDVDLISYSSKNINSNLVENSKVRLILIPLEKNFHILFPNFKREIKDTHPQIFQSHGTWVLFNHWMAVYARKNNIPYIITPRGNLEPYCIAYDKFKKLKKKIAMFLYQDRDIRDAVCLYATAMQEALNLRALGYRNPIAVIPNGIDLSLYPLKKYSKVCNGKKKQMLFLSRIHPKKGIELLLNAWSELPENISDRWELSIVGNGDIHYLSFLNSKIKKMNLTGQVSILPPVFGENKIQKYHEADIFILPSYSENFGMVVAEALACGIPVITTKNTPWETIIKSNCGWWIDLTVDNIKTTLIDAMSLPDENLRIMGENGRALVEKEYSFQSTSLRTKKLYEWILGYCEKPEFVI